LLQQALPLLLQRLLLATQRSRILNLRQLWEQEQKRMHTTAALEQSGAVRSSQDQAYACAWLRCCKGQGNMGSG
jgi:hypothetical protein